jgi:hypothetical protein
MGSRRWGASWNADVTRGAPGHAPPFDRQTLDALGQDAIEDRRGRDGAVGQLHRLVVAVAGPDSHRELGV